MFGVVEWKEEQFSSPSGSYSLKSKIVNWSISTQIYVHYMTCIADCTLICSPA